jgi:hypothetical protein
MKPRYWIGNLDSSLQRLDLYWQRYFIIPLFTDRSFWVDGIRAPADLKTGHGLEAKTFGVVSKMEELVRKVEDI